MRCGVAGRTSHAFLGCQALASSRSQGLFNRIVKRTIVIRDTVRQGLVVQPEEQTGQLLPLLFRSFALQSRQLGAGELSRQGVKLGTDMRGQLARRERAGKLDELVLDR